MSLNFIDIENGVAGFSQQHYKLKRHAHFPIEVIFTLTGQLDVDTDFHQYKDVQSAIIPSNVPHTFALQGECQLYFVDPTSNAGQHISRHFLGNVHDIQFIKQNAQQFTAEHIFAFPHQRQASNNIDDRIQRCLGWINTNFLSEQINMSILAKNMFLSESRLAHMFKQQIGISVRQYILWKRVEVAVKRALDGFSLTDCAYDAGFADSSHFIKTFQKMFGIYPSFATKK